LAGDGVEQLAELDHPARLKRGIVANVEAEEVDVVDLGEFKEGVRLEQFAEVRLAKLVAAAGGAAAGLDAGCVQRRLDPLAERLVRVSLHQCESVVAGALKLEVGPVLRWVKVVEERLEIFGALTIALVEPAELRAAHHRVDLGAADVVR